MAHTTESDLRDIATLVAEIIRRMGSAYGSGAEWSRDTQEAVHIMERANLRYLDPAALDEK